MAVLKATNPGPACYGVKLDRELGRTEEQIMDPLLKRSTLLIL